MRQPSALAAIDDEFLISQLQALLDGRQHVRIVLLHRKHPDLFRFSGAHLHNGFHIIFIEGIKIPQNQIRFYFQIPAVGEPPVRRNHIIPFTQRYFGYG